MSFAVHELPRAKADKRSILVWLLERSPKGGRAWLDAYDDALHWLAQDPDRFESAIENKDCPNFHVRQALFKTRRGRIYRILFFRDGNDVFVLRVRGPGQAAVDPYDLS